MTAPLWRRALAEAVGTGALVMAVVGSGIAAQRLTRDTGLELLENTIATAAALAVLIAVLAPISGAHFNPVVTLVSAVTDRSWSPRAIGAYVAAQVAGGVVGVGLANAMFGLPVLAASQHHRDGGHLLLAEVVATAGLVAVIFVLGRVGSASAIPWAVAAYIASAYWFTSSTSFANPAVSIGRSMTDTFSGIAPSSLPGFVLAQLVGGAVGLALVLGLTGPTLRPSGS